jgi:ribonuclease HI
MVYAADIWFTPIRQVTNENGKTKRSGSVGFAKQIAKAQRIAGLAILGAFRTTPNDLVDMHANLLPAHLLLEDTCLRAASRLAALPSNHPLAKHVQRSSNRYVKSHRSPLHELMNFYQLKPETIEKRTTLRHDPRWQPGYTTTINTNLVSAIRKAKFGEELYRVFTDGSGYKGGIGAAAILYKGEQEVTALRYYLGTAAQHTVYEAEAVALLMGSHLLSKKRLLGPTNAWIGLDNQAVIQASTSFRSRPGHYIIDEVQKSANALLKKKPNLSIEVAWCPGHKGIIGNERADVEAKKAAKGDSSEQRDLPGLLKQTLPGSVTTKRGVEKAKIWNRWDEEWAKSTRYQRMKRIDSTFNRKGFMKTAGGMNRKTASLLLQMRTEHVPLNAYLSRMKCTESRACPTCGARSESVFHYLTECRTYERQRSTMLEGHGRKVGMMEYLLSSAKGIKATMRFVEDTGRFKQD